MGCSSSSPKPLPKEDVKYEEKIKSESVDEDIKYLFKVLLIGDSGVGKTSLLMRFTRDEFHQEHINTIGIDFKVTNIQINKDRVKLQIWDTAGQERFRTLTAGYYRGAHGIMLVYDITVRHSFDNIHNWLKEIDGFAEGRNLFKVLIGNKQDLSNSRCVTREEAQALANKLHLPYVETSAKLGDGVKETFEELAKKILNAHKETDDL
eukprot:TRINITY_DN8063_c0_g1_i1.p1 TRINITY_DN8063_c0_g1~~TRINITY_DN8063_c0_g1_i1.p1  ORF type:complete len:207 (-),score=33.77 TRINITY_DN8063_c0_g1_i1:21-641(-)